MRQAANGYCCFQRGEKAGALGFWQAIEEVWPQTRGQRCWVHKTANVLNKLPKSQQSKAKRALQEIWMAEPPSPGWRTFLRNHAPDIAAMDLFIAPTIGFDLLYVLVIVSIGAPKTCLDQRHTSSDRGMDCTPDHRGIPLVRPRYLIRDRDRVYGAAVTHRLRAMGIRDKPIAPGSPWQNGFAERLIGSIRRDCVDHVIVFGEAQLRRILTKYAAYYNELRTHQSLAKDAPPSLALSST